CRSLANVLRTFEGAGSGACGERLLLTCAGMLANVLRTFEGTGSGACREWLLLTCAGMPPGARSAPPAGAPPGARGAVMAGPEGNRALTAATAPGMADGTVRSSSASSARGGGWAAGLLRGQEARSLRLPGTGNGRWMFMGCSSRSENQGRNRT